VLKHHVLGVDAPYTREVEATLSSSLARWLPYRKLGGAHGWLNYHDENAPGFFQLRSYYMHCFSLPSELYIEPTISSRLHHCNNTISRVKSTLLNMQVPPSASREQRFDLSFMPWDTRQSQAPSYLELYGNFEFVRYCPRAPRCFDVAQTRKNRGDVI
jgi:hypothetical protein